VLELLGFVVGLLVRLIDFLGDFWIIPNQINMISFLAGSMILTVTVRQLIIGTREPRGTSSERVVNKTFNNTYNNTNPTYNITKSNGGKK
jgi:hypothetical protein